MVAGWWIERMWWGVIGLPWATSWTPRCDSRHSLGFAFASFCCLALMVWRKGMLNREWSWRCKFEGTLDHWNLSIKDIPSIGYIIHPIGIPLDHLIVEIFLVSQLRFLAGFLMLGMAGVLAFLDRRKKAAEKATCRIVQRNFDSTRGPDDSSFLIHN